MAERMLKFVRLSQAQPEKRGVGDRRRGFPRDLPRVRSRHGGRAGRRCSQCGVPFCQIHCPLHNNIPDWLRLTAEGRLEEAYEVAAATNTMPEICGRICPQDRLCEGNCVIEQSASTASPSARSRSTSPTRPGSAAGSSRRAPRAELAQTVGIIGAGPAGLAAAERLRGRGYQVTSTTATTAPAGC